MKKLKFLFLSFIFLVNISNAEVKKTKIVATTTNIAALVKEIAKDKVEVINIIPYGMCPGHFDLSIKDVKKITEADLFIYHGWELWIKNFLDKTKKSYKISVEKNLMIPEVNLEVAKEILEVLCEISPENKNFFEKNYDEYYNKVRNFSLLIKQKFEKYKGVKVISSEHQKEFLTWLGFEVVYSYPRQEQVSLKDFKNIFSLNEKIVFVADNLQSGSNVGKQLAKDLKIKHIVLTNFVESDYIKTLNKNIKKIEKILE